MNLEAYLQRIDYSGSRQPTQATLRQLHRAHLLAIPYENLDIHLGRQLTLDLDQIYRKIVEARRGGWCYEMNGLFAWALRELGFDVTMLGSSVGEVAQGGVDGDLDHLILLVQLEQPWLADVGFGNGILEPLPLQAGEYSQGFLNFRLQQEDEKWYFHNQPHGGPGFGFTLLPRDYASFASRCHELQTAPESGFVRTTVCHRFTAEGMVSLRGAVLKTYRKEAVLEEVIESLPRYQQVLHDRFDLQIPQIATLWDTVQQRHQVWQQAMENTKHDPI